jgi:VanZ family protein
MSPSSFEPWGAMLRNYKLWQWLLAGYWLALFAATHVPKDFPAVPSGHWDKLAHFVAYALLAVLIATTWQLAAGQLAFDHLRWAWIVLVAYGAIDEWTQSFVGRDASWLDWLADGAGAAAGLAVIVWVRSRYTPCHHSRAEIDGQSGTELE